MHNLFWFFPKIFFKITYRIGDNLPGKWPDPNFIRPENNPTQSPPVQFNIYSHTPTRPQSHQIEAIHQEFMYISAQTKYSSHNLITSRLPAKYPHIFRHTFFRIDRSVFEIMHAVQRMDLNYNKNIGFHFQQFTNLNLNYTFFCLTAPENTILHEILM